MVPVSCELLVRAFNTSLGQSGGRINFVFSFSRTVNPIHTHPSSFPPPSSREEPACPYMSPFHTPSPAQLPWVYCPKYVSSLSIPTVPAILEITFFCYKISKFCSTKLMTEYKRVEQRKSAESCFTIKCVEVCFHFMSIPGGLLCPATQTTSLLCVALGILHSVEPCLKLPHRNQFHTLSMNMRKYLVLGI